MTTRAQLQADVTSWLDRDVTSAFDAICRVAESLISRHVRLRVQETATVLSVNAEAVALPADFLSLISLSYANPTLPRIVLVSPHMLRESILRNGSGDARLAAIEGGTLLFAAPGTVSDPGSVDLVYFARFDPLVLGTDTNEFVTDYYDVALDAFLHAAGTRFRDRELADSHLLAFQRKIAEVNDRENMSRFGGSRQVYRDTLNGAL